MQKHPGTESSSQENAQRQPPRRIQNMRQMQGDHKEPIGSTQSPEKMCRSPPGNMPLLPTGKDDVQHSETQESVSPKAKEPTRAVLSPTASSTRGRKAGSGSGSGTEKIAQEEQVSGSWSL